MSRRQQDKPPRSMTNAMADGTNYDGKLGESLLGAEARKTSLQFPRVKGGYGKFSRATPPSPHPKTALSVKQRTREPQRAAQKWTHLPQYQSLANIKHHRRGRPSRRFKRATPPPQHAGTKGIITNMGY
jgi:hypothetical protein